MLQSISRNWIVYTTRENMENIRKKLRNTNRTKGIYPLSAGKNERYIKFLDFTL